MEKPKPVPKEVGQQVPPNFVEVKREVTPNGTVMQEFRQIHLFRRRKRGEQYVKGISNLSSSGSNGSPRRT
jgi:hypothetical protein